KPRPLQQAVHFVEDRPRLALISSSARPATRAVRPIRGKRKSKPPMPARVGVTAALADGVGVCGAGGEGGIQRSVSPTGVIGWWSSSNATSPVDRCRVRSERLIPASSLVTLTILTVKDVALLLRTLKHFVSLKWSLAPDLESKAGRENSITSSGVVDPCSNTWKNTKRASLFCSISPSSVTQIRPASWSHLILTVAPAKPWARAGVATTRLKSSTAGTVRSFKSFTRWFPPLVRCWWN